MYCKKCKSDQPEDNFLGLKGKLCKTCKSCREFSKNWKQKNKDRVKKYNDMSNKKKAPTQKTHILGKLKDDSEDKWIEYETARDAATKLNLQTPNISKVLHGHLKTTGGYIFKKKIVENKVEPGKDWETIKKENGYTNMLKGKPSVKRILHEEKDGIMGKKCCMCKTWKCLDEYNNASKHWDNLRSDCKECLVKYRKNHRKQIQNTMNKYEKQRKKVDPAFKLSKELRSKLGRAIKRKTKLYQTLDLIGCSVAFLKGYLEAKFTEGMTWENHGEWHIDHIKPCSKFNLLDETEQKACFHYKNLQPLWGIDNLVKGDKFPQK